MTLWQVTPLSRPERLRQVIAEFMVQTLPRAERRLCVVLNSAARDLSEVTGPDMVLRCSPGKPTALNAAMSALTGELLAIRDDDDASLPMDLEECLRCHEQTGAEVISRLRHLVTLDGVPWLFAEDLANQWGTHSVWGGSLLFRNTPDVPEFPGELVTESQSWARRMIALGARVWRPGIENQVHVRTSFGGMWGAGPLEIRRTLGFHNRARRYAADGSFEWIESPTMFEVAEERLSTEREFKPMRIYGQSATAGGPQSPQPLTFATSSSVGLIDAHGA